MTRAIAFAVLGLSGVAIPSFAQSGPVPMTKHIEYYNPDWSPDGKRLVFESTLTGKYAVYSINPDGTALRQLTADSSDNEQARWSPDGTHIVFSSNRAGHSEIYVMNADGSNPRRVTTTASGSYYQSSFSPNGKFIAFQGRPNSAEVRDRVYVVAIDGSGMRQLSDSAVGAEGPRWTRDGSAITFTQVPYPKRLWSEMTPADMAIAKKGERRMSIRPDGSGLVPARPEPAPGASVPKDAIASRGGRQFAYTKSVDGFSGLYVYDVASSSERLVTGGPGVGPVGYLRTVTPTAGIDTVDTFESARGGVPAPGNGAWVIRTVRQIGGRRWELTDTWFDAAGRETARQSVFTASGSLAIERETTRANGDSASLLATADRIVEWVVPGGKPARLFEAPKPGEFFAAAFVRMAIAKAKPSIGATFVAPTHSLYGSNPLTIQIDSFTVVRRDSLMRDAIALPVLVLAHGTGGEVWVDETTGAELLSRGNAGPERWWWHIRRGVRLPGTK